jgi:hypothetical protein
MTSDIDMLPLSDYWYVNESIVTTWGHDLTNYGHYPICYIGMTAKKWKEVMNLTGDLVADMKSDLDLFNQSKSDKFEEWWQVDQDIITERLNAVSPHKILRGIAPNTHYPLGRIDRGAWEQTLQQEQRIDAHLLRNPWEEVNFTKTLDLIQSIFPKEDLEWMIKYRNEYVKRS